MDVFERALLRFIVSFPGKTIGEIRSSLGFEDTSFDLLVNSSIRNLQIFGLIEFRGDGCYPIGDARDLLGDDI